MNFKLEDFQISVFCDSCEPVNFINKKTGKADCFYKVYYKAPKLDNHGNVFFCNGFSSCNHPFEQGEEVILRITPQSTSDVKTNGLCVIRIVN